MLKKPDSGAGLRNSDGDPITVPGPFVLDSAQLGEITQILSQKGPIESYGSAS